MTVEIYTLHKARQKPGLIGLTMRNKPITDDCEIYISERGALAIAYVTDSDPDSGNDHISVWYAASDNLKDEGWDRTIKLSDLKRIYFGQGPIVSVYTYIPLSFQEITEKVEKAFVDYANYLVEAHLGLHDR